MAGLVFHYKAIGRENKVVYCLWVGWSRRSKMASLTCMHLDEDDWKSGLRWTVDQSPARGVSSTGVSSSQ